MMNDSAVVVLVLFIILTILSLTFIGWELDKLRVKVRKLERKVSKLESQLTYRMFDLE